jgi:hypothetical protein
MHVTEQRRIVAKLDQLMALVDESETQNTTSHDTAVNHLSALVAELTVITNHAKVSIPKVSTTGSRGRPPKS